LGRKVVVWGCIGYSEDLVYGMKVYGKMWEGNQVFDRKVEEQCSIEDVVGQDCGRKVEEHGSAEAEEDQNCSMKI
jgi:hypothetical protein